MGQLTYFVNVCIRYGRLFVRQVFGYGHPVKKIQMSFGELFCADDYLVSGDGYKALDIFSRK